MIFIAGLGVAGHCFGSTKLVVLDATSVHGLAAAGCYWSVIERLGTILTQQRDGSKNRVQDSSNQSVPQLKVNKYG